MHEATILKKMFYDYSYDVLFTFYYILSVNCMSRLVVLFLFASNQHSNLKLRVNSEKRNQILKRDKLIMANFRYPLLNFCSTNVLVCRE